MRPAQLLFLLLAALIADVDSVKAIDGVSNTVRPSTNRLLANRAHVEREFLQSDGSADAEERGFVSSAVSKIKSFFRKTPGISSKVTHENTDIVVRVKKMPIVNKLESAIHNDPTFMKKLSKDPESMKKLAKDPDVKKLSTTLEKNNIKITKDNMNQLRSAAGNDPVKLSALDVIDGIAKMGIVGGAGVMVLVVLVASGWAWVSATPLLFGRDK